MFLLSLTVTFRLFISAFADCGQPALPVGIYSDALQINYPEGYQLIVTCKYPYEVVTYGTPKGHLLPFYANKAVKLICNSGKWIGKVPRCAEAIPLVDSMKIVKHIDFLRGYVSPEELEVQQNSQKLDQYEVDMSLIGWGSRYHKNMSSCVYDVSSYVTKNHTWVLFLRKNQSIAFISIELRNKLDSALLNYANPAVTAVVNRHRTCRPHYIENTNTNGALIQILCEVNSRAAFEREETDIRDKLFLYFNNEISKTKFNVVSLCIYTFPKSCGTPEIPINTKAHFETSKVRFSCLSQRHVYKTYDKTQTECTPDSKWSNSVSSCRPIIVCPLPAQFSYRLHNIIVVDNSTEEKYVYENAEFFDGKMEAVIATVEIHVCFGYVSVGRRICGEDGNWIGTPSTCDQGKDPGNATFVQMFKERESNWPFIVILSICLLISCLLIVGLLTCIIFLKCRS